MLGTALAKAAIGLVARLMTETFLAKLIIEGLRAWSDQTENPYDNHVVAAIAEALGVEVEALTPKK